MPKSSSNKGSSLARLTIVALSAARNASRSARPVTLLALSASSVSASETRTPFCRSRLANSTSFSSIRDYRGSLVQQVLVAGGRGAAPCARLADVVLQFLLRFSDVALVLHDRIESFVDQLLVQCLDVEQSQRLDPVECLADSRGLLQIDLAQRLDDVHHFLGQACRRLRPLGPDDRQ